MPIERKDRVSDTTTTTGTGTVTLTGTAPTGYRSVSAAHTDGATVRYAISMGSEWEVGEGVYTASGTTLSRVTVFASSNAGSLVDFSAGTKTVVTTLTASEVGSFTIGPFTAWTSGAYKDITGLPSGTKRITISPKSLSTTGTSNLLIQIGDATGGLKTSGYESGCTTDNGTRATSTAGFIVSSVSNAAYVRSGTVVLTLVDPSNDTWAMSGQISETSSGLDSNSGGQVTLSGPLDRFRFTTVGGSDTGDAGGFGYSVEV